MEDIFAYLFLFALYIGICAFFASIGEKRSIGGTAAFFAVFWLGPFGMILVLCSKRNVVHHTNLTSSDPEEIEDLYNALKEILEENTFDRDEDIATANQLKQQLEQTHNEFEENLAEIKEATELGQSQAMIQDRLLQIHRDYHYKLEQLKDKVDILFGIN